MSAPDRPAGDGRSVPPAGTAALAAPDRMAGHLTLRPGAARPVVCERPIVGAAMMRRLTEGRRASLLPDLLGAVFTLCASAQRLASRRAVLAAMGRGQPSAASPDDGLLLAMVTAREHLQRLALDLPAQIAVPGLAAEPGWLRDAPVLVLPARPEGPGLAALQRAAALLPGWLERRLLGLPAAQWWARWQQDPQAWLAEWAEGQPHPLARWLTAVRPAAVALALPCRPLALLDEGEAGLRRLAAALTADPGFAERPLWGGAPAETGPWTRQGRSVAAGTPLSLWQRLGERIADLVQLALGGRLACGGLTLASGEGLAWCEMSRGLLLHWVRLEDGPLDADTARASVYRVVAPTEWNFHPDGALAEALRSGRLDAARTRLAAVALDPCVAFDIVAPAAQVSGHA